MVLQQIDHGHLNVRLHKNNLIKFQHPIPKNSEDAPFKADPKQYGAKVKFVKDDDSMP